MLSVTDTTLDFLILELVFQVSDISLLFLGILLPVGARSEYDVLCNRRSVLCQTKRRLAENVMYLQRS